MKKQDGNAIKDENGIGVGSPSREAEIDTNLTIRNIRDIAESSIHLNADSASYRQDTMLLLMNRWRKNIQKEKMPFDRIISQLRKAADIAQAITLNLEAEGETDINVNDKTWEGMGILNGIVSDLSVKLLIATEQENRE